MNGKNKISGIYKITNPIGEVYIGQSNDLDRRFSDYKKINRIKYQRKVVESMWKYGFDSHSFEIIELCNNDILKEREYYYQCKYNSVNNGLNCISINPITSEMIKDDITDLKFTLRLKGAKQSDEHIAKRVKSKSGYIHNEETKNKISEKAKLKVININTGIIYDSVNDAHHKTGISRSMMTKILTGKRDGYLMYLDKYNQNIAKYA